MSTWGFVVVALGLGVFLGVRLHRAIDYLRRHRGKRLITCPETKETAAVEVASARGAARTLIGRFGLELGDCSRWPDRQDCGQDCLSQIEADPEGCLVWNIVMRFYQGKSCVICGRPFGSISWHDHRPALLDEDLRTVQWTSVLPQDLPKVLATHSPICWNCHIAETFRRAHSDRVTDRRVH